MLGGAGCADEIPDGFDEAHRTLSDAWIGEQGWRDEDSGHALFPEDASWIREQYGERCDNKELLLRLIGDPLVGLGSVDLYLAVDGEALRAGRLEGLECLMA